MHTKTHQDPQEGAAVNKSPKVRLQSTIMTKVKNEQVTKRHNIGNNRLEPK